MSDGVPGDGRFDTHCGPIFGPLKNRGVEHRIDRWRIEDSPHYISPEKKKGAWDERVAVFYDEEPKKCDAQEKFSTVKEHNDMWAHRSANMRCRTCMYFALKQKDIGRCRRHAPTMGGYPAVMLDDWCGDHKIDETKWAIPSSFLDGCLTGNEKLT